MTTQVDYNLINQQSSEMRDFFKRQRDLVIEKISLNAKAVENLTSELAADEKKLIELNKQIEDWERFISNIYNLMAPNQPLTRRYIRQYLGLVGRPVQVAEIIDALYHGFTKEERKKLIKKLSVMLNRMKNENEVFSTTQKGKKGNFFEISTLKQ
ncbi:MAG: hypothetical protein QM791_02155 [Ferruginibacter sp.]